MKRVAPIAVCLMLLSLLAGHGAPPRVAVADFNVSSDDPKLKYVGKGLAEMVAAELFESRGIKLIDRDKRAQLLGEIEFSLSDLADTESQVKVGKLLAADYLMFGEIVDMGAVVLVTCKLIKADSGEVTWTDKHLGPLSDYGGISRKLASSALNALGAKEAAAVAAAPRPEPEEEIAEADKEKVILAFSEAVDSYDRKDKAEARKQLRIARAIDPDNAAVAIYAAKLAGGSPRFLVELDRHAPTYNPALLGFIDKGTVYMWSGSSMLVGSDVGEHNIVEVETDKGSLVYKESASTQRLGVLLPFGQRLGLMVEYSNSFVNNYVGNTPPGNPIVVQIPGSQINLDQAPHGAGIGLGYQMAPGWGVGLAGRVAYLGERSVDEVAVWSDIYPEAAGISVGVTAGLSYRNLDGDWSADFETVWSNQPDFYVLSPDGGVGPSDPGTFEKVNLPLLLALGVTHGFLDQSLFANAKLINDVGLDDRGFYALRAIPGIEWWPFPWGSLRGAYEFALVTVNEGSINGGAATASGSGFMGGTTVVFRDFEISANYIYRFRPFRLLPGAGHQDQAFLVGVTWSGFMPRK